MAQLNNLIVTGSSRFLNVINGVCTDGTAGTTKFMRQDGTWQVPPNDNTDTKVTASEVNPSSLTTYYPTLVTGAGTGGVSYVTAAGVATKNGTTSANGYSYLVLGNSIDTGTVGNKFGGVILYSKTSSKYTTLAAAETGPSSSNATIRLPATSGTVALTSDIPTKVSQLTNDSGYTTNTGTITGSGTSGYIAKWNGGSSITNGPAFGSDTTKFLRNDGSWVAPPNDNTKVTQTATSTDASYEVLFSGTADNTDRTEGARKYSNLTFNPSMGLLSATTFSGAVNLSATGLTVNHAAGYTINQYGNFVHKRDTNTDLWRITNFAEVGKFSVNYETGDVNVAGSVYAKTTGKSFEVWNSNSSQKMRLTTSDTPRAGIYDIVGSKWLIWRDEYGYYRIGSDGYAIQVFNQAKGTTKYNLNHGIVVAYRYSAANASGTVAYIGQWGGDSVVYQHHVNTINVSIYTSNESIQVANNTNGYIQVILIGKFWDNPS